MTGRPRFRPMGIADILDETAEIFRGNFVLLMAISAVIEIPLALLLTIYSAPPDPAATGAEATRQLTRFAIALVPVSILLLLLTSVLTGALTFAISDIYVGRPASVGSCYRRVLTPRVLLPLAGALIVKYLVVALPFGILVGVAAASVAFVTFIGSAGSWVVLGLLMIALFVAAAAATIYMLARTALVEPCVVLERAGVGAAIKRSWRLVQGSVWKAVLVIVIVIGVILVAYYLITGPTTAVVAIRQRMGQPVATWLFVLHLVITAAMSTITAPAYSIATILLYYDMRIRKEGFDLELLAEELDAKARRFTGEGAAGVAREQPAQETLPPVDDQTPPEEQT